MRLLIIGAKDITEFLAAKWKGVMNVVGDSQERGSQSSNALNSVTDATLRKIYFYAFTGRD